MFFMFFLKAKAIPNFQRMAFEFLLKKIYY